MSVGNLTSAPPWEAVLEHSPVATIVFGRVTEASPESRRSALFANAAARSLVNVDSTRLVDEGSLLNVVEEGARRLLLDALRSGEATTLDQLRPATSSDRDGNRLTAHISQQPDGTTIAQVTSCQGWDAVDQVLDEQQRFRSALMELSELAYSSEDDEEFYQRLIERAVEVVPGAQGGSVQLNIPGTAKFRFVAAVGYDLDGLKANVLEQQHFFRDAWNPMAQIVSDFDAEGRSPEITEWLQTVGRLSEIVVNVSAPVLSDGFPVAFLSLDNFEDRSAITETAVEMTTVLSHLIGELWRRRELEAAVRKEREAFRHLALHDPLTGLANRRNLERVFEDTLDAVRRRGHPAAVLFVDVDDFKGVNDRLGHEVGDQVLIGVASGLNRAVRAGDVVGRWGGDEFLIVPRRLESTEEAIALAERVLDQFTRELVLDNGLRHRARVTVGIGWSNDGSAESESLVRAADEALYEAKSSGKGVARLRKT